VDLDRLLNPGTIAFVGGRPAELAIAQCDALGYEGAIWPVHPTRETVAGRRAYRSVADLPAPPDAALVAVNRHATVEVVNELAKLGAGGAVCYASGFAEAGPEGAALQQQLVDHDMPVIGPNCYGTINTTSGAALWPDVQGCHRRDGRRGAALVTQSGNIALNLTMNTRGLDFTHVISLGNQAGVRIEDSIATLAADPAVAAIGVHAEAIVDSIAFARAAQRAHANGTPIVMLKTGVSEASAAIAASHTAAIAKPADVYQALFDRYGVITVDSVNQLAATLGFLVTVGPLTGARLVSLSCSGGEASLVADRAAHHDVVFEPFAPEQARRIDAALDGTVAVTNPLDYHTFIWDDQAKLTTCFTAALDGTADAALLVLDWPTSGDDRTWLPTLEAIASAHATTGTPTVVAASLAETMPAAVRARLQDAGIAAAYSIDEALAAVAAAARAGRYLAQAPPRFHTAPRPGSRPSRTLTEGEAKKLLATAGITVPRGHRGHIDALSAVDLRFPVVAKASGVAHKTDVGGVIVDIADAVQLQEAVDRLAALSDEVLIEEQVPDVVAELLVTVRREPPIGDVLVLGSGGELVELLADTATALLPLTEDDVVTQLGRLRVDRLLAGHRGQPAADRAAIAQVVAALTGLFAQRPDILEIEINPLLATPAGAVAVDALITLGEETA
jgi:acyl-CoA synthetase (NDP forming)